MRKPINVSVTEINIIAICDDGSIWEHFNDKWTRLPDIPQDEQEDLPQMLIKQN